MVSASANARASVVELNVRNRVHESKFARQLVERIMTTLSLAEAQARLPEIVHGLSPGEEVVITENSRPIARVVAEPALQRQPRQAGTARGILTIVRDDDEHLKDFE